MIQKVLKKNIADLIEEASVPPSVLNKGTSFSTCLQKVLLCYLIYLISIDMKKLKHDNTLE